MLFEPELELEEDKPKEKPFCANLPSFCVLLWVFNAALLDEDDERHASFQILVKFLSVGFLLRRLSTPPRMIIAEYSFSTLRSKSSAPPFEILLSEIAISFLFLPSSFFPSCGAKRKHMSLQTFGEPANRERLQMRVKESLRPHQALLSFSGRKEWLSLGPSHKNIKDSMILVSMGNGLIEEKDGE